MINVCILEWVPFDLNMNMIRWNILRPDYIMDEILQLWSRLAVWFTDRKGHILDTWSLCNVSSSLDLRWSWQTPGVRGRIWHRLEVLGVGGYLASRVSRMSIMLDDSIGFLMNFLHLVRSTHVGCTISFEASPWLMVRYHIFGWPGDDFFWGAGDGCEGNASASSSFWRGLGDQLLSKEFMTNGYMDQKQSQIRSDHPPERWSPS